LDEILTELRDSGELAPEDIVVLSPLVDSCAAELDRSGKRRDLEHLPAHRTGASSYGTLAAFKGLEAPAVILTDIGEVATPGAQRLFYVGVSRATDHLRVLARDGLQESVAGLITGVLP
jgi:superfamily I DNA/RNA helicase